MQHRTPTPSPDTRIRVLVVDDSHFMQRRLKEILEGVQDIRVVGCADNGAEAIVRAEALRPDVITMDINMPKLDGLHAIDYIMRSNPLPIVVVSSYTRKGGPAALYALELGVIDIVEKPSVSGVSLDLHQQAQEIVRKVRVAARVRVVRTASAPCPIADVRSQRADPSALRPPYARHLPAVQPHRGVDGVPQVIAIGASTGGPVVLKHLLARIPSADYPPVLIVQHLPERFTRDLAQQIDALSALEVVEAEDGWPVVNGFAYLAPGGRHMEVDENHRIGLSDGPPVNCCRPAVDMLFHSVARHYGAGALGCVLTGMGDDGAAGSVAMRAAGASVLAQDEDSCVVFGMPQAAHQAGGADGLFPLEDIARLFERIGQRLTQHQRDIRQRLATPIQELENTTKS